MRTGILKKSGFTFVEVLVVTLIMSLTIGGLYLIFAAGQATWFATDTNIQLQENLRRSLDRLTMELRQTDAAQYTLFDDAGFNNTDVVRFSIPVICEVGGTLINSTGDVSYWRAPLTWGCTNSTCMDADNDCSTIDYKSVEYRINNSSQLVRVVLDNNDVLVRQDIFAENISDFQIVFNTGVFSLNLSSAMTTADNRPMSAQAAMSVTVRN